MRSENLKNLIEGLRDISCIEMEIDTLHFFVRNNQVDILELGCEIFDDTGLQDIIDAHTMKDNFSSSSCLAIVDFEDSFQKFVRNLSEREKIKESLSSLRVSANMTVAALTKSTESK